MFVWLNFNAVFLTGILGIKVLVPIRLGKKKKYIKLGKIRPFFIGTTSEIWGQKGLYKFTAMAEKLEKV